MSDAKGSAENRELRRTLRDLVALTALPAAWVGRTPEHVAQGLAELLVSMLRLDAVFVCLTSNQGALVQVENSQGWPEFTTFAQEEVAQTRRPKLMPIERRVELATSQGSMLAVVTPLGLDGETGTVITAAQRQDFPTELETLLLSVAANQAIISFQTAKVLAQREAAERALRESQSELSEAQRLAQIGSWKLLAESGVVTWSEELYRIAGRDPSMPPPQLRDSAQLFTEESWARLQPEIERALREGSAYAADVEMVRSDGTRSWVTARAEAERGLGGQVIALRGTVQSIAERRAAEDALRRSEQDFRALANSIPQLTWMANPDGYIFWYNQRWYEYTGTTPSQMEGWGWQAVHDPQKLPNVMEQWKKSISTGQLFEMELPLRGGDGIFRWFLTLVVPVRNSEGELLRWFGTNTNIHEQRQARVALQLSEERLHAALAASDTGTFRWNPHTGEFLEFDENLKRLFGFAPEQSVCVTEDFVARVYPEDLPSVAVAIDACRKGADFAMEYRVLLPDGSIRWLYDRAKMEWKNGEPQYLVGACTDITAKKFAAEALLQTEKLASVGRLAATVAHEINNPLEAVTNYIFLSKTNPHIPPKVNGYLEIADQELARVSHIAQQTLGFYRSNSQPQHLNVVEIVDDVLRIYERKVEYKGARILREINSDLTVYAVQGELKQAISNLIANAIEACCDGGQIRIRARSIGASRNGSAPGGVRITIADDGSGIPAAAATKIFTPFFTTKKETGTGLGLWVTKAILEKHHGQIRCRSRQGEKSGTVMTLYLPEEAQAKARSRVV
jgi:PAS domain S-box-containing protein